MRRTVGFLALAGLVAALASGCSSSSGTDAGGNNDGGNTPDSGNTPDGGSTCTPTADAGCPGTITTASSNNKVPAPWPGHVADFASDNSGAAKNYLSQVVQLTDATAILLGGSGQCGAAGYPSCSACPTVYVFTSTTTGKSYCDGFSVQAGGAGPVVYGDSFAYTTSTSLTTPTNCTTNLVSGPIPTLTGVWEDHYNSATALPDGGTGKTDTYSIAIRFCPDIGVGTNPYNGTGTPRAGTVASTLASNPANGSTVTVIGVVTAAWSASGGSSFGFSLQDYAGGPNSGIAVGKAKASTSTAAPPNVGDDITVTGAIDTSFGAKISL